jgi:hypothetical protein
LKFYLKNLKPVGIADQLASAASDVLPYNGRQSLKDRPTYRKTPNGFAGSISERPNHVEKVRAGSGHERHHHGRTHLWYSADLGRRAGALLFLFPHQEDSMRTLKSIPTIGTTLILLFILTTAWGLVDRLTSEEEVKEAINNNPDILTVEQNMAAAEESAKSARAQMLLSISAGYGYTALKEKPIMKMDTGDLQMAHQQQYNWDITIVQPLFAGFALKSQYDIAKLETASRVLEKQQTILDLAQGVRSTC